jgi:light-regulated signal transduction histidine kinase (bacteriophytochrome)
VRAGEVFRNLIANAVKYNTRPSGRWVEVGARPPENGQPIPVLYVQDNGIGIAPEHHQAVFRIFKRLHARDEFGGGIGSGLAIVKRIVERHGGRVWIESSLDEGATFLFTLGQTDCRPVPPVPPAFPRREHAAAGRP